MARTALLKATYFLTIGLLLLVTVGAVYAARLGDGLAVGVCAALIALLLLRGWFVGLFWSDLFAGLQHLNRRDYPASKLHSERFLVQLRARPWIRKLMWISNNSYTRNVEVMALNNLGAAHIALGEFEDAKSVLSRAIDLDPRCPLPYKNMGALILHSGTAAEALPWLDKAHELGLTGHWTDRLMRGSQARYAARMTGGSSAKPAPFQVVSKELGPGGFVVVLINDDKSPLEFVVSSLEQVFGLTGAEAIRIAFAVHETGRAPTRAFATEAAAQAMVNDLASLATAAGWPLASVVMPRAEL